MHFKILFALLFSIPSICSFAQDQESILKAPDNWKGEIIPFPISFAPSINYAGFEDLRFTPGWADSSSQEFWTYTFVWFIEMDTALTEGKLKESFNAYYDGLMGVDRNENLEPTVATFSKSNAGFSGEMRVYDAFFTHDYMTLFILVNESFCPKSNKQLITCEISPQPFDHQVWKMFDQVEIMPICN